MTRRVKTKAAIPAMVPIVDSGAYRGWIVRFRTEEDSGRYSAEIRIGAKTAAAAITRAAVRVERCYPKMLIAVMETTAEPDPEKPPSPENS
jgi:hypothetical protein